MPLKISTLHQAMQWAEADSFYKTSKCKAKLEQVLRPATVNDHSNIEKELGLFVRRCAHNGEFDELKWLIAILCCADESEMLQRILVSEGAESKRTAVDYIFEGISKFGNTHPWQQSKDFVADLPVEFGKHQNEYLNCLLLLSLYAPSLAKLNFKNDTLAMIAQSPLAKRLFTYFQDFKVHKDKKYFDDWINSLVYLFKSHCKKNPQEALGKFISVYSFHPSIFASIIQIKKTISTEYASLFEQNRGGKLRVALLACGMARELIPLMSLADEYNITLTVHAIDTDESQIMECQLVYAYISGSHKVNFTSADARKLSGNNQYDLISLLHPEFLYREAFTGIIRDTIPRITGPNTIITITNYWCNERTIVNEIMADSTLTNHVVSTAPVYPLIFKIQDKTVTKRVFCPMDAYRTTLYANPALMPAPVREADKAESSTRARNSVAV